MSVFSLVKKFLTALLSNLSRTDFVTNEDVLSFSPVLPLNENKLTFFSFESECLFVSDEKAGDVKLKIIANKIKQKISDIFI